MTQISKVEKKFKDIKMDESVALRFRRLGCSGLSGEKLIIRVLDVIDDHPEIKQEIMDYDE